MYRIRPDGTDLHALYASSTIIPRFIDWGRRHARRAKEPRRRERAFGPLPLSYQWPYLGANLAMWASPTRPDGQLMTRTLVVMCAMCRGVW